MTFNANGSFTYAPNAGFTGIDSFTYRVGNAINYTAYDEYGNVLQSIDAEGNVTNSTWDARSRLLSTTDSFGHNVTYAYDGLDRKIAEVRADDTVARATPQVIVYRYTANGEIASATNNLRAVNDFLRGQGHTTEYQYDALNRLVGTFQQRFAEAAASRPDHLSVVVGNDGGTAPVTLSLVDPLGKRLGIAATGETQREIPFANYFPLQSTSAGTRALALLASPQNGRHVVEVTGSGDGVFDLGVVVPANGGLQCLTFEDVAITAGAKATLVFNVGSADPFELSIDDDDDGAVDRTLTGAAQPVVDQGPQLVAATQVFIPFPLTHPSKYGLLIAALFSEEVDLTSAEHNVDIDTISRFFVDNNRVRSAFVQPRGRVVTMYLRDGIGPFVDRSLTATEIKDVKLNSMAAVSETVAIRTVKQTANGPRRIVPGDAGLVNGTVRRADGTPVPNARIYMSQRELDINDEPYWVLVTVKDANADGTYSIDYVRTQPTKWEFLDPATNERGQTGAQPSFDSQSLTLDLILRGRGTLTGKVTNSSGQPLAEAFVRAKPIANIGLGDDNDIVVKTNAEGNYVISGAPVGTLSLTAVHPQSNAQVKATAAITEPGSIVVQDLTVLSLDFPQNFGTLQGQVFREDGVTPAPNVPVYTSLGGTAVTDATGSYRIENLPVGEALIRAFFPDWSDGNVAKSKIVFKNETRVVNVIFRGKGTVTGTVYDDDGVTPLGA